MVLTLRGTLGCQGHLGLRSYKMHLSMVGKAAARFVLSNCRWQESPMMDGIVRNISFRLKFVEWST